MKLISDLKRKFRKNFYLKSDNWTEMAGGELKEMYKYIDEAYGIGYRLGKEQVEEEYYRMRMECLELEKEFRIK